MNEPFSGAKSSGFRDLVQYRDTQEDPLHGTACRHARSHRQVRRPMLTRLVRALTERFHYIKVDKEATKAVIGKIHPAQRSRWPGANLQKLYAVLRETPTRSGRVKTLLDDMAPRNPKAAAARSEDIRGPEFVQEMESSALSSNFTESEALVAIQTPVPGDPEEVVI